MNWSRLKRENERVNSRMERSMNEIKGHLSKADEILSSESFKSSLEKSINECDNVVKFSDL